MSTPEGSPHDELTETLARLLDRVDRIEERLSGLEARPPKTTTAAARPPVAVPRVTPPAVPAAAPLAEQELPQVGEKKLFESASSGRAQNAPDLPAHSPADLETRLGLTWINRIGVVTLIIGIAFFFKYAVDNQWIGESGRVILGILAGLATLAAGELLFRRGQKVFSQGICGLGISILYLSFYASFAFYHLLPQPAAFVLMAMTSVTAGTCALRYDAIAIAGLTMLGAYLTPVLLSTGHDAPWTFFSYILLIDVAAFLMSKARRWWLLQAMAFGGTALLYASWYSQWFGPEKLVVAAVAVLSFYALFTVAEWPAVFYLATVLTGIVLAAVLQKTLPYLALSLAVAAAGLTVADRRKLLPAATVTFTVFWAGYALWRFPGGRAESAGTVFLLLTCAFTLFLAWVPLQILVRHAEVKRQHLLLIALNGAVYFGFVYRLLAAQYRAWLGLLAASVAGVHLLLGMELWKKQAAAGRDTRPILLALGIASGFLTLAVPIQFTGVSITLFWAMEAAMLVWISGRIDERRVLFGALAVYLFVLLRLYLFDAPMAGPGGALLWNLRFVTFVVAAVSLWLGARWTKAREREMAATLYVAGHLVMLSAWIFELDGWTTRMASPDNQNSLMAIGISILIAIYAVLLIGMGVWRRTALDRTLGVGLMGIVVLKLYLNDVWEVSRLFRMTAFVALGVLLLLASYLYSRFRPVVENWLKDEQDPT